MPTCTAAGLQAFVAVVQARGRAAPDRAVQLFGVRILGATAETGRKVPLSVAIVAGIAIRLAVAVLSFLVLVSIWFDDPGRLTGTAGLITAGLTIALQCFATAFAAYFVILRSRVFRIGDRIVMGGVRRVRMAGA